MFLINYSTLFQKYQERSEAQTRTITSLEGRCISLKNTIEQMNQSLAKAATTESEMKDEMNYLHRSLIEMNAHAQSDADRIKQVIFRYLYIPAVVVA